MSAGIHEARWGAESVFVFVFGFHTSTVHATSSHLVPRDSLIAIKMLFIRLHN